MLSDNTLSAIRSALKIGGTVLTMTGVLTTDQFGVISTTVMDVAGCASMLYGLYLSYQTHK